MIARQGRAQSTRFYVSFPPAPWPLRVSTSSRIQFAARFSIYGAQSSSASKNILSLEPSTAFFPRRTNQPLPATSPQAGGTSSPAPPPAAAPPPRRRSDPPSSFLLAAAVELDESRRRRSSSPASSSADRGGGPRALRPGARRILVAAFELSGLDLGGSR